MPPRLATYQRRLVLPCQVVELVGKGKQRGHKPDNQVDEEANDNGDEKGHNALVAGPRHENGVKERLPLGKRFAALEGGVGVSGRGQQRKRGGQRERAGAASRTEKACQKRSRASPMPYSDQMPISARAARSRATRLAFSLSKAASADAGDTGRCEARGEEQHGRRGAHRAARRTLVIVRLVGFDAGAMRRPKVPKPNLGGRVAQ